VIRTKMKAREKASRQLRFLEGIDGRYDYRGIATNSDLIPLIVWKTYIISGTAVRTSSNRVSTAMSWIVSPAIHGGEVSVV
jgi:hypothetical protein